MAVLIDTGILYALADRDDAWHDRARTWFEHEPALVLAPITVLPEACYLLHARLGAAAERALVRSVARGELEIDALRHADIARCEELMARYPDMGFVDVSLVAVSERLKITAIATTDRRHFSRIRPKHIAAFRLLP